MNHKTESPAQFRELDSSLEGIKKENKRNRRRKVPYYYIKGIASRQCSGQQIHGLLCGSHTQDKIVILILAVVELVAAELLVVVVVAAAA